MAKFILSGAFHLTVRSANSQKRQAHLKKYPDHEPLNPEWTENPGSASTPTLTSLNVEPETKFIPIQPFSIVGLKEAIGEARFASYCNNVVNYQEWVMRTQMGLGTKVLKTI